MTRRLLPLGVFLGIAVLLFAGVRMNSGRDTSAIPSPLIGKQVPSFTLPLLGDATRRISDKDLLGKPYLLNVWGSWCPTCQYEQPFMTELARTGKIRIVGYDYKDTTEDAQRWLKQFGDPYEMILADEDGQVALDWGIYGAPESFLVDAQGVVRWKVVGPIDDEVIRTQIEPRLASLETVP